MSVFPQSYTFYDYRETLKLINKTRKFWSTVNKYAAFSFFKLIIVKQAQITKLPFFQFVRTCSEKTKRLSRKLKQFRIVVR